jgi:hypothetical protein
LSDLMVRSPLLKVYAGVEFLRHREGQKNLVYLGPRLPIQDKRDEHRLAQRANNAQVTLHIIGTMGTPSNSATAREAALALANLSAIQGMQYLTSQTGGGYTGLRFAADALADIDRASRTYYLIGYQPVSVEDDRSYRRVDVRVARKDVNVRFRTGYFATGRPDAAPLPELLAQARVESTVNFDFDMRDIVVKGTATFKTTTGDAGEIAIALTIEASRVGFQPKGTLRAARLGLTMVAMNDVLTMFGGGGGTMDLEVDDQTFAGYQKDGIPVKLSFPVAAKPKRVKVIVYAFNSDLMGTVNLPVR